MEYFKRLFTVTQKPTIPKPLKLPKQPQPQHIISILVDNVPTEEITSCATFKKPSARDICSCKQIKYFSHAESEFIRVEAPTVNPLGAAAHFCYANHVPFEMTPDILWNTILQGLSACVNANSDLYRTRIVNHKGKHMISVHDDDTMNNNWSSAIEKIRNKLCDQVDPKFKTALQVVFTTTGPVEAVAHSACLMDTLKTYFAYEITTMCGIPRVDIAGHKSDYQLIASTIGPILNALDLTEWNTRIQFIISGILNSFDKTNSAFWSSMYKYNGPKGSGGQAHVTGWLGDLFPYLKNDTRNPNVHRGDHKLTHIPLASIPSGCTTTPFLWTIGLDKPIRMELVAGLVGVGVTGNGAVKAEVGYAIGIN